MAFDFGLPLQDLECKVVVVVVLQSYCIKSPKCVYLEFDKKDLIKCSTPRKDEADALYMRLTSGYASFKVLRACMGS